HSAHTNCVDRSTCHPSSKHVIRSDHAPSVIYPPSLHDALPICAQRRAQEPRAEPDARVRGGRHRRSQRRPDHAFICRTADRLEGDRKSTRLNSSHQIISYAVFCLKKKTEHRLVTSSNRASIVTF